MELKTYVAQNASGDILPEAKAYLYLPGTTTLVEGLQDAAGNPLGNPVSANAAGQLIFAAPNGRYDMHVTTPGREYTQPIQCNDVTDTLTAAQAAADAAQVASVVASEAVDLAQVFRIYATYAEAAADIWNVPAGLIVRIVADETRGGASSYYRSATPTGESLILDFAGDSYQITEDPLSFLKVADLRLASVPASATALGTLGQVAIGADHLYIAVGDNLWRRVALTSF